MKKFFLKEKKIVFFIIFIFVFFFFSFVSLYFYNFYTGFYNKSNNNFYTFSIDNESSYKVLSYGVIPLLAVSLDEFGNVTSGSVAFLELNIINGSGKVFVNSEPFSKVDTQASTVFANKFACDFLDFDCSKFDFLYSIKSDSPIVGGPSASAAVAFLTISLLSGNVVPKDVAITGTINSGGVIGNVGGVKEKIFAAENFGLKKVFVPAFSNVSSSDFNISVFKVSNIKDVFSTLNYNFSFEKHNSIFVPEQYFSLMKKTSDELCFDNDVRLSKLKNVNLSLFDNSTRKIFLDTFSSIESLNRKADFFYDKGMFYSRASFCFNVRTKLYYLEFLNSTFNLSFVDKKFFFKDKLLSLKKFNEDSFFSFKNNRKFDINSIQVYSIVKERHDEANVEINNLLSFLDNYSNFSFSELNDFFNSVALRSSYVFARVDSSVSWMNFKDFNYNSKSISFSSLKNGCVQKLNEASSLLEYVNYILGFKPVSLDEVYDAFYNNEFDVCIFKASLVKAKLDLILSSGGLDYNGLNLLFDAKNFSAFDTLAVQSYKGFFPVMGYSYYEYAQSLGKSNDSIVNSLLYLEDAIELSGLDIYFNENKKDNSFFSFKNGYGVKVKSLFLFFFYFFLGVSVGGFLFLLFLFFFLERIFEVDNGNIDNTIVKSKKFRRVKK